MMRVSVCLMPMLLAQGKGSGVFSGCASVDENDVRRLAAVEDVCACGASLPNALYQMSTFAYAPYRTVTYTATGSSTGKKAVENYAVDFAGSDSLLKEKQYTAAPDLQMYPATAAAVVPIYYIPEIVSASLDLVLDRNVLPKIFMGDVYTWDDDEILSIQTGGPEGEVATVLKNLANKNITVVVRDDGSGTSEIFTKTLSLFSPCSSSNCQDADDNAAFEKRIGGNDVLDWCEDGMENLKCPTYPGGIDNVAPTEDEDGIYYTNGQCNNNANKTNCFGSKNECEGVSWEFTSGFSTSGTVTCQKASHGGRLWSYIRGYKNAGSVAAVFANEGSVGYAVLSDAIANGIDIAQVKNKAGVAVTAGPASVSFALMELGGGLDERGNADLMDAASTYAWPIAGYTYYILRKGVHSGTNWMTGAPTMFDCSIRENTIAYLEWFYTSDTVRAIGDQLGFTNLPDFIAKQVIGTILADNYCNAPAPRLAKEAEPIINENLYISDLPRYLTSTYTAAYREVDPRVIWISNAVSPGELATTMLSTEFAADDAAATAISSGLGVAAFSQSQISTVPEDVVASPLFIAGVVPQYHLGSVDDLELTLDNIVDILTGTVSQWNEIRSSLPEEPIKVVIRTDACDSTEIVSTTLSMHSTAYAEAIGVKRQFESADYEALGDRVVLAVSEEQVQASVTYYDNSIGMWSKLGKNATKMAKVKRTVASEAIELDYSSLQACVTGASLEMTAASTRIVSTLIDAAVSTSELCWPFSRAYHIVIKEGLVGQSMCSSSDKLPGNGVSRSLEFSRWLYTGSIVTKAMLSLGASPAEDARRAAFMANVLEYECNPDSDDASTSSGGSGGKSTTIITSTDNTPIIAGMSAGVGAVLIASAIGIWYYKRRVDLAAKFANAKLPENVQEVLESIYEDVIDNDGGENAQYIPDLANAEPNRFGIVLVDMEGKMYKVGDTDISFSIQSACKPTLYMLALEQWGKAEVGQRIGEEPSGQPFNALSIDPQNRAYNPYVNAGAIVSASLIGGTKDPKERFEHTLNRCKQMAYVPERLKLDESVYKSETATNSNNQNIARELRARHIITEDPAIALDAYTMACSMAITCEDAAVMAATFANNGTNPISGEDVINSELVNHTVTVMMSCGMYNGAGKWIVDVGIPAKSGVAGLVMCVVPGVCGIGIFSPRLDANGNSTRGVLVATAMSEQLGLHVLKQSDASSPSRAKNSSLSHNSRGSKSSSARHSKKVVPVK